MQEVGTRYLQCRAGALAEQHRVESGQLGQAPQQGRVQVRVVDPALGVQGAKAKAPSTQAITMNRIWPIVE